MSKFACEFVDFCCQAEDGIRDERVTGVQTCALPIEEHTSELQSHSHLVCAWSSDVCSRSEEHTSELQSHSHLVCRLLLEKKISPATAVLRCRLKVITYSGRCAASFPHSLLFPVSIESSSRVAALSFFFLFFFFLTERAPPKFSPFPLHAPLPT